jgi:hypothetical protein
VVQNTKRSRDDVSESTLIRDYISETTPELVEETGERASKGFKEEEE